MEEVKILLLDADYITEKKSTVIRLFGVDENGNSVVALEEKFLPYFYILPRNESELRKVLENDERVVRIEKVRKGLWREEREFLKVYVKHPPDASKVRDKIKHRPFLEDCFEYTLNFSRRYLIDRELYPFSLLSIKGERTSYENFDKALVIKEVKREAGARFPLKVLAFDIEVVGEAIVMVSVADNRGYKNLLSLKKTSLGEHFESERALLQRLAEVIGERDPDVIVGYNTDQYDFEVIKDRAEELKAEMVWGRDNVRLKKVRRGRISSTRFFGRVHIDLFNYVNNILSPHLESEVLTLSQVSEEILREGKEELSLEEIIELWEKGPVEALAQYNLNDAELTLKLSEALLPQVFALSEVTGQLPFDTSRQTYGLLVDSFLLRKSGEKGWVSPNQPHFDEIQKRRRYPPYKGGYVHEPKVGLHENIALFDFRSLYPSIIVTFNISPETLNCDCCDGEANVAPEVNYRFCRKFKGFVPSILEEVLHKRFELKKRLREIERESLEFRELDEKQFALKVLSNSFYGYLAYPGARWYSRECAEAAAAWGRHFITQMISLASKYGEVIYGDTDSLFVKMEEGNVEKFLKEANSNLPGIIELEFQGFYQRGLFVFTQEKRAAKKRYALLGKGDTLLVRGFETVRKDWCEAAKKLQRNVLRFVLEGKVEKAIEETRREISRVKRREVSLKELAIHSQLGKELTDYKSTSPHLLVAKKLKEAGEDIRPGVILSYVITEGKGSISERAEALQWVKVKDYDVDYYLNNQLIPAALRVLQVFGYSEKELEEGQLKLGE
jgi:DNA polymerase I/DNA polymerase-2